jgi:hypothetical protein
VLSYSKGKFHELRHVTLVGKTYLKYKWHLPMYNTNLNFPSAQSNFLLVNGYLNIYHRSGLSNTRKMRMLPMIIIVYMNHSRPFKINLFICAYIVWVISPPCPLPPPSPSTTLAFFSNFVEEKT